MPRCNPLKMCLTCSEVNVRMDMRVRLECRYQVGGFEVG
jgi:hypothetical protein